MTDKVKLLLKQKYGLVHVPNHHKVKDWFAAQKREQADGASAEDAGIAAARAVFPYEYKEHAVYEGPRIEDILEEFR